MNYKLCLEYVFISKFNSLISKVENNLWGTWHKAVNALPYAWHNVDITRFPAHMALLSQCALAHASDILPCTGKCVNDIMPETLPRTYAWYYAMRTTNCYLKQPVS